MVVANRPLRLRLVRQLRAAGHPSVITTPWIGRAGSRPDTHTEPSELKLKDCALGVLRGNGVRVGQP